MTIVIGNVTPKDVEKYQIVDYKLISKVCELNKDLDYVIYILNTSISDYGLIYNTEILLDELFITYHIQEVYYKLEDYEFLLSTCNYFGITVYSLNE